MATENKRAIGQFLAPEVEFTPSKSISQSPGADSEAAQLDRVNRCFSLGHVPSDELLEHLDSQLASEKEDEECQALMPQVAEELRSVDWSKYASQDRASKLLTENVLDANQTRESVADTTGQAQIDDD